MMYGETFYGRHTAQHQLQFKLEINLWDWLIWSLMAQPTLLRLCRADQFT